MSGFTGIPKAVLEIIPKAACFWILVEGHSASRLCAAVCSLVPTGMLRAGNKSPHGRDGHAPFFCATKSNFEGTMVSFNVRSASHRPRNCSHASAAPAQRRPFGAQLGTWDTKNSTRHRRARRVFTHSPHQASSLGFITFLQAPESRSKASASSTEAPSSTRFANAINRDNSERTIGSKR
jgi:hypothetical protein